MFDVFKKNLEDVRRESLFPLKLRMLATLLSMKIDFLTAIKIVSEDKENDFFKAVRKEVESGISIGKSLANASSLIKNEVQKKTIIQLISAYEHGDWREIKKVADELIEIEKFKIREKISQASLISLGFVIVSSIFPTFLIVFSVVGKVVFKTTIDESLLLFLLFCLVPAINLLLIFLTIKLFPPLEKREKEEKIILIMAAFTLLFILVTLFLEGNIEKLFLTIGMLSVLYLILRDKIEKEKINERIEDEIGLAILSAVGIKSGKIENIFKKLGESGGVFGNEMNKIYNQLIANVSLEKALENFEKSVNSFAAKRFVNVFKYAYISGCKIGDELHNLAEDLFSVKALVRERENALSMQKYTLLIAGIIIPIILTASFNLVNQLESLLDGVKENTSTLNLINVYITIYAFLVSLYIEKIEGKASNMFTYFAFILLFSHIITLFLW